MECSNAIGDALDEFLSRKNVQKSEQNRKKYKKPKQSRNKPKFFPILCNFSDPEVSWYEEGIGMNSSTGRVAAMKAAETADQQSDAEQKAIFSVCFYFFGFAPFLDIFST